MEMFREGHRSDIGYGTIESLLATVDRLCRDYPTMPAARLRDLTKQRIRYVHTLLPQRKTLSQHRELLTIAGWLYLLLGCVQMDLGNRQAAEVARDAAYHLGKEAEHPPIVRWSFEMLAWFALTESRVRDVGTFARAGQELGGEDSSMVQLILQEAKSWARLGDATEAQRALDRGKAVLDRLPIPEHPEHHFVFDPTKYAFYAATTTQWLGDDSLSEEYAREVFTECVTPDGTTRLPMRIAEVQAGLGIVAARRGRLDEAIDYGNRSIGHDRKSGPSLLVRIGELDVLLRRHFPNERATDDFRERYVNECRLFGFEPPPVV
jgi:hypothetical protein